MTIDLENNLDRICPLRTLEMTFQSSKISKFLGHPVYPEQFQKLHKIKYNRLLLREVTPIKISIK